MSGSVLNAALICIVFREYYHVMSIAGMGHSSLRKFLKFYLSFQPFNIFAKISILYGGRVLNAPLGKIKEKVWDVDSVFITVNQSDFRGRNRKTCKEKRQ